LGVSKFTAVSRFSLGLFLVDWLDYRLWYKSVNWPFFLTVYFVF